MPAMYLAHENWSPRYDQTFFSVKITANEKLKSAPDGSPENALPGKTTFPAFYYTVAVYCGSQVHQVQRRYSQFQWLHQHIPQTFDVSRGIVVALPPTPCFFHFQTERLADNRTEELNEYLRDILQIPGNATDSSVAKFLGLYKLAK